MNSLSEPLQRQSLVETIIERLEVAIMRGDLASGERLSELSLAKMMGVSRGPLREAMRQLEGRKLIERVPGVGARVASMSVADLENLLVVREALEGMACRLAAERISDAELSRLKKLIIQHARQKGIRENKGYYQQAKDFDFHFVIIEASGNQRLIDMLCGDLYDLLRVYRYKSSMVGSRASRALAEHERIVTAIANRDGEAAEVAMREHLRMARQSAMLSLAKVDLFSSNTNEPSNT